MRFTKMHGIGNDYVYVSTFDQQPPHDPAALARAVSDRHFGIGGDGLILIMPSERADARMRMFNADGSEGEMCGNGVRCVAKYLYDHGIARKKQVTIETGRGVLTLDLEVEGRPRAAGPRRHGRADPAGRPDPDALARQPAGRRAARGGRQRRSPSRPSRWAIRTRSSTSRTSTAVPLETLGPLSRAPPRIPPPRQRPLRRDHEPGRGPDAHLGARLGHHPGLRHRRLRRLRRRRAHRPDRPQLCSPTCPAATSSSSGPPTSASVFMTGPATEVFSGEWPD